MKGAPPRRFLCSDAILWRQKGLGHYFFLTSSLVNVNFESGNAIATSYIAEYVFEKAFLLPPPKLVILSKLAGLNSGW